MSDTYIKLFTTTPFRNEEFAELLCEVDVEAVDVNDGIILNLTQFEDVPVARLPHWVYLNRRDILSPLHTRPASMREFRDAQGKKEDIHLVGTYAQWAFGGYEFGQNNHDVYVRTIYEEYVGPWEKVEEYDIADDNCTIIYHLRGGIDISGSEIMRIGA